MKPRIVLPFFLLLFAFSCKKDTNNAQLIGKWIVVSGTGGPGSRPVFFMANTPGPTYVQFEDLGKIQTTFFINCIKYSVSGNEIVLTYDDSSAISNVKYSYSIKNDTLIMNDESCAGCQVVFAKQ
jgi:hypothetical protein